MQFLYDKSRTHAVVFLMEFLLGCVIINAFNTAEKLAAGEGKERKEKQ